MKRFILGLATLISAVQLSACNTITPINMGDNITARAIPAGNNHLVITRLRRNASANTGEVLCTEPSPDFVIASSKQLAASLAAVKASGSLNYSNADAVTALAGRTAGVIALRDALYQACISYGNGQLGQSAYSLLFSQYGNVLVALVGGSSGSSTASAAASSTAAPTQTPVNISVAAAIPVANTPASENKVTSAKPDGDASKPDPTAVMKQEHAQAIIVSCLNAFDPTLPSASNSKLLTLEYCKGVFDSLKNALPSIFTVVVAKDPPAKDTEKPAVPASKKKKPVSLKAKPPAGAALTPSVQR